MVLLSWWVLVFVRDIFKNMIENDWGRYLVLIFDFYICMIIYMYFYLYTCMDVYMDFSKNCIFFIYWFLNIK